MAHIDKMIRAKMLGLPIQADMVDALAVRPWLHVASGSLTVLRTDARRPADASTSMLGDAREWVGFHVDHSDAQLEETSLRWWRSDPAKVVDNVLFAVTVGTFPVAVYAISGLAESQIRGDEDHPRHHYEGQLLARVTPGMAISYRDPLPGHVRTPARQIMNSRITVTSGGPIGYAESRA